MTPTKQEILEQIQREYAESDESDLKYMMGFFLVPIEQIRANMSACIDSMTSQVIDTVKSTTGMTHEEAEYWFYTHADKKQNAGEHYTCDEGVVVAYYFGVHIPYSLYKDYDPQFETIH